MAALRPDVLAAPARAAWHDRWVIRAGAAPAAGAHTRAWRAEDPAGGSLSVTRHEGSDLRVADDEGMVVLAAGTLTNAREIDPKKAAHADAAELVRDLLQAGGVDAIGELRGPFAVIAWDRRSGRLIAARDQIGIEPLFYARGRGLWLFAASPDVLVAQPEVSGDVDAVVLSEWLCGWYPGVEDTAYRSVKRVPPATVLAIDGPRLRGRRYWDPAPGDRPVQWLADEDLEQFDALLTRAVARTMPVGGRAAVFLSGGLDSIAVALTATDVARADGSASPVALSLAFPAGESNEEPIQRGVAQQLGLAQELAPFTDACGPEGLVAAALTLSAGWPQPMWNIWAPAYMHLAGRGLRHGSGVILTGRGGDEWLTVTPYVLADLVARGNLTGAWRLLQTRRRSNKLRGLRAAARLLWLTAGRPLGSAACDWAAPALWHGRRRRRLLAERPAWLAPDPAIRRAMDERVERWIVPARPKQGFYVREMRTALTHPAVTHDMEETQEFGRRLGQRVLHPFWDVDLVSVLYRTRPEPLIGDGQTKWLLRRRVVRRLPGLGLERRGKLSAERVFRDIMIDEGARTWAGAGGLSSLSRLGVVRSADLESAATPLERMNRAGGPGRMWSLLNLESWVRPRM